MSDCTSDDNSSNRWICHLCDHKSQGESRVCSVCYKTTCFAHLKTQSFFNEESGLYELRPVCLYCATSGLR